jgi:nucleoid-associated protein YgaU
MDTVLRLGDFEFSNLEVPESIALGGDQRLAVHKFPGGARTVQAMGADHEPLQWTGLFLGGTALERAKYLDFLRVQGAPLPLTMFDSTYTVVISKFRFIVERYYKVGYSIALEVVSDDSQPVQTIAPSGFDTAIDADCDSMLGLGDLIGDGPLSRALSVLDTAVRGVSSFATATNAVVQQVQGAIGAVAARVSTLSAAAMNTIGSVTAIGGVVPNVPLAQTIGTMAAQVTATTQAPILQNLTSLATRMSRNVSMAQQGASARSVQVAGGTLFDVAAREYGDATRWISIAQASGLTDAVITGVKTLQIPANPIDSGGVPTQ